MLGPRARAQSYRGLSQPMRDHLVHLDVVLASTSTEQYDDPMSYDELRAQFDIRSWVGTAAFPFGFLLMGIEFSRFIFSRADAHRYGGHRQRAR